MDLASALPDLVRPFAPEAVKARIQDSYTQETVLIYFIDARLAASRLNSVVGGEWSDEFHATPFGSGLECRLTVCGVQRRDVGFSTDLRSDMGIKALYSDAFKRAAVKFGIGASLYALPRLKVPNGSLWRNPKGRLVLTPFCEAAGLVVEHYREWLDAAGIAEFGEVYAHGDAPNAQGDVETGHDEPAELPPVSEYEEAVRNAIRALRPNELGEDEWARMRGQALTADQRLELRKLLEEVLVQAGGDLAAVRAAFKAGT